MTRSEFESLQLRASSSGMTLKAFLSSEGIAYSTYNYWRRKCAEDISVLPLAPIEFKASAPASPSFAETVSGAVLPGVTLAFPNGVRAHFGTGSEGVLLEVLNQSMNPPHVLS